MQRILMLVGISTVMHFALVSGILDPDVRRFSGGDPIPCTGTSESNVPCPNQPGKSCKHVYLRYKAVKGDGYKNALVDDVGTFERCLFVDPTNCDYWLDALPKGGCTPNGGT